MSTQTALRGIVRRIIGMSHDQVQNNGGTTTMFNFNRITMLGIAGALLFTSFTAQAAPPPNPAPANGQLDPTTNFMVSPAAFPHALNQRLRFLSEKYYGRNVPEGFGSAYEAANLKGEQSNEFKPLVTVFIDTSQESLRLFASADDTDAARSWESYLVNKYGCSDDGSAQCTAPWTATQKAYNEAKAAAAQSKKPTMEAMGKYGDSRTSLREKILWYQAAITLGVGDFFVGDTYHQRGLVPATEIGKDQIGQTIEILRLGQDPTGGVVSEGTDDSKIVVTPVDGGSPVDVPKANGVLVFADNPVGAAKAAFDAGKPFRGGEPVKGLDQKTVEELKKKGKCLQRYEDGVLYPCEEIGKVGKDEFELGGKTYKYADTAGRVVFAHDPAGKGGATPNNNTGFNVGGYGRIGGVFGGNRFRNALFTSGGVRLGWLANTKSDHVHFETWLNLGVSAIVNKGDAEYFDTYLPTKQRLMGEVGPGIGFPILLGERFILSPGIEGAALFRPGVLGGYVHGLVDFQIFVHDNVVVAPGLFFGWGDHGYVGYDRDVSTGPEAGDQRTAGPELGLKLRISFQR